MCGDTTKDRKAVFKLTIEIVDCDHRSRSAHSREMSVKHCAKKKEKIHQNIDVGQPIDLLESVGDLSSLELNLPLCVDLVRNFDF